MSSAGRSVSNADSELPKRQPSVPRVFSSAHPKFAEGLFDHACTVAVTSKFIARLVNSGFAENSGVPAQSEPVSIPLTSEFQVELSFQLVSMRYNPTLSRL